MAGTGLGRAPAGSLQITRGKLFRQTPDPHKPPISQQIFGVPAGLSGITSCLRNSTDIAKVISRPAKITGESHAEALRASPSVPHPSTPQAAGAEVC
jgi:hypothetical protein